jgi:hypothetical protein
MREIVRASAWGGFRELVVDLGGDADELLAAAHVDVAALADPERYMPLKTFIDSLAIAAERLERPDFGLMFGTRQNLTMLAPSSSPSPTLRLPARASRSARAISTCTILRSP